MEKKEGTMWGIKDKPEWKAQTNRSVSTDGIWQLETLRLFSPNVEFISTHEMMKGAHKSKKKEKEGWAVEVVLKGSVNSLQIKPVFCTT